MSLWSDRYVRSRRDGRQYARPSYSQDVGILHIANRNHNRRQRSCQCARLKAFSCHYLSSFLSCALSPSTSIPSHALVKRRSGNSLNITCCSLVYQLVTHIALPFTDALTQRLTTSSHFKSGFMLFGCVLPLAKDLPRKSVSTQPGQKQVALTPYFFSS